MEDSSLYKYAPLKGLRNIRILRLTGGNSRILFAELIETSLDSHLSYEAISYTWGNPDKSHSLAIQGGSTINITESLYNALVAIRHSKIEDGARNLWVDGVCINQDSETERSQQVQLMAEIYQSANRVITYVGENILDITLGLDLANKLISCFNERRKSADSVPVPTIYAKHNVPDKSHPSWAALRDFLDRSWYTRIWIIQESLQNPNMIMMCGNVEINWQTFTLLNSTMQQSKFNEYAAIQPRSERQVGAMGLMAWMQGEYRRRPMFLLELLAASRDLSCADPRDRVFALSSLCRDAKITPDYSKSKVEIYTETARHLLSFSGIMTLSYAGIKRTSGMPSWVPDWSVPLYEVPVFQCRLFNASSCLKPTISLDTSTPGILRVSGKMHDEIVHVTDTLRRVFVTARMERYSWIRDQYLRLTSSRRAYPGGQTYCEAIWRTLISDLNHKQRFCKGNAPASLGGDFEEYVRPVKKWARWEALQELLRYHPDRKPKPPDIDPVVIEAWRRDLCLDTTHSDDDDGRENAFSALHRHQSTNQQQRGNNYRDAILSAGNLCRKLFTTKSGYIGMGVAEIEVGDTVAFFSGAAVPFVLRRQNGSSAYELVSDCYVHGTMNGEAWRSGRGNTRIITLV